MSRAGSPRHATPRAAFGVTLVAVFLLAVALYSVRQYQPVPDSRQSEHRIQEIRELEPQRSGTVRIQAIADTPRAPGDSLNLVRYFLQAPGSRVEDAELRGLLAGEIKYPYNQGTAYHMRVGRRFGGAEGGLYELKRALVRWELPPLPRGSRIVSADATFWIESLDSTSPLARPPHTEALHLYAYPVDRDWSEGSGGKRRNNFSPALRGEVTWSDARAYEEPWPSPGVLEVVPGTGGGYRNDPLAEGTISASNRPLTLSGRELAAYADSRFQEGKSVALLLKLDDVEEDQPGTEISLLTSDFGDVEDGRSKHPRLELVAQVPGRDMGRRESFLVEAGSEREFAPVEHAGRTVLLAATVSNAEGEIAPGLFLRGGLGAPSPDSAWQPFTHPVERRWDWSQVMVRSPAWRVAFGDSVGFALREYWVRPGPRARQRPELALVAPSGRVYRILGRVSPDDEYRFSFVPPEPGLWRYGWSYRPTPHRPPEGHQGEGLFYVALPEAGGAGALAKMRTWVAELESEIRRARPFDPASEVKVNALCKWAAEASHDASPAERKELDGLIARARAALTH